MSVCSSAVSGLLKRVMPASYLKHYDHLSYLFRWDGPKKSRHEVKNELHVVQIPSGFDNPAFDVSVFGYRSPPYTQRWCGGLRSDLEASVHAPVFFQCAEKTFHHCIVITVAFPTHAQHNPTTSEDRVIQISPYTDCLDHYDEAALQLCVLRPCHAPGFHH